MFYPYNSYSNRVRTIDSFGIPVMKTIYVITDTTNNTVTYGICPKIWRQLPCEGMILLNVSHTPASTVTAASLVSIDTTSRSNQVNNTSSTASSGARALLNGSGEQMVTEEVSTGNRYLIYYNKNNGTFQTVNHIVIPAAANA